MDQISGKTFYILLTKYQFLTYLKIQFPEGELGFEDWIKLELDKRDLRNVMFC